MRRTWPLSILFGSGAAAFILAACATPAVAQETAPAEEQLASAQVSLMGPGLRVADLEIAVPFYTGGLGLTLVRQLSLSEGREEVVLAFGDNPQPPFLSLVGPLEPGTNSRTVLAVSDIAAVHDRLAALGYEPGEMRVHEDSGTQLFWASDPDGNGFEIIQLSPRDAARAGRGE